MKLTRRQFAQLSAMAGGAMMVPWRFKLARAQLPGGTLPPGDVPKFVTPLVKPPAMPLAKGTNRKKDQYQIAMRQFIQQILPAELEDETPTGLPATTVWSYGPAGAKGTDLASGFFYPAFTVEATANRETHVIWKNQLIDADGGYLPHLLPVDPTLHWANPPGGLAGRDTRPTFASTPEPYTGPVPMITHVHGAHTREDSDGYPEAWYLPDANNIPADYARTGTFFDYFSEKYEHYWALGGAGFKYPNDQPAATLWYHDHTLGMTRLNVYAGPAGFWLIRGGDFDMDDLGYFAPGRWPADPFGGYTEIPIAIQDRSFNEDGSLFYPDSRTFFDGFTGPYIGDAGGSDVPPIWNPEFFGNTMVVNGRTWPYLEVERKRYRFRLLNGCNSRFLVLKMTSTPRSDNASYNAAEYDFYQIGSDQGFLPKPVQLGHLLMAPAERADVIVDFTNVPADTVIYLVNDGPDAPFGEIPEQPPEDLADWESTGLVMQFRVTANDTLPLGILPTTLRAAPRPGYPQDGTQYVTLNEQTDNLGKDIPVAALLGTWKSYPKGVSTTKLWSDPITENIPLGNVERFTIRNFTEDAHPIHIHQVHFQVENRQPIDTDPESPKYGETTDDPHDDEPWEAGYKDTVIVYPGELVRVRAVFDLPGLYVWHCHIVEHEDNEMMRPFHVGPTDPLAPLPSNSAV